MTLNDVEPFEFSLSYDSGGNLLGLLFRFNVEDLGLASEKNILMLNGELDDGTSITGEDTLFMFTDKRPEPQVE